MKPLILLVGLILIGSSSIANVSSSNLSSSSQLNTLGSVWKTYSSLMPKQNSNDLTIVYGGADISRRPTLAPHITTA